MGNIPRARKKRKPLFTEKPKREVVLAKPWVDDCLAIEAGEFACPANIPRYVVYNTIPCIVIEGTPTTTTKWQADQLFEKITKSTIFKTSKIIEKREYWQKLFHTLKRSIYFKGCVR